MTFLRRALISTVVGGIVVTASLLAAQPAAASTPGSVRPTGFAHEFWNYDYDTKTHQPDNPVTIIFVSKHSDMVDRIYDQLLAQDDYLHGGSMQLQGWGGSRSGVPNTHWISNSAGRKTSTYSNSYSYACWHTCPTQTDVHLRVYGPSGTQGTQVYQGSYGSYPYYVIGTTHYDTRENTSSAVFGFNDTARSVLYNHMKYHGWHYKSSVWVNNKCYWWTDNSHYCQSNGYAWVIDID